jgi:hypothetical protein
MRISGVTEQTLNSQGLRYVQGASSLVSYLVSLYTDEVSSTISYTYT